MTFGSASQGAKRWLDFGFFQFQPSELMKLAVPMAVAWFMSERRLPPTLGQLFVLVLIVLMPTLMIASQPDLGTAVLVAAAGGLTIMLAGIGIWVFLPERSTDFIFVGSSFVELYA